MIVDFDGTMTDDHVYVDQDGRELVRCHRADGWGVRLLREAGIEVLCVTGEDHPVVRQRCRKLGLPEPTQTLEKAGAVREAMRSRGLSPAQCVFLGNGLNDVPALQAVGWPVVVRDAHPAAKRSARRVLASRGGEGAVLELAEWVLADARRRTTRGVPA